jgi:protein transport protein SEC20
MPSPSEYCFYNILIEHRARISFRKAQLTAKHNLELAQRAERALLLSTLADPSSSTESLPVPRRKNLTSSTELTQDEKIINASSDVTSALRRTHQLMQAELSRSQFAHDTLKESTAALAQLSETYSTLDTLLSSSRNLLGTLLKSQKSDTWYLETAFYVLAITIGWLIFRRFIYGPAWWFIWLPLKMFYKAWMGVFTAVGLRSSRDGVFTSNAVVGTTEIPGMSTSIIYSSATGSPERAPPRGSEPADRGDDSIVEEVGKMIDDAQQAGSVEAHNDDSSSNGQTAEGAQHGFPENRNPKKRMWEEPVEAQKEEQRKKDEL